MKSFALLSIVYLLVSCAASGPHFKDLEKAPDNEALVYILRPPAFAISTRSAIISINGEQYIKLMNGGYTIVRLKPGVYEFMQSIRNVVGDVAALREVRKFDMEVKAGKTYFIGFHADSAIGGPVWVFPVAPSGVMFVPIAFEMGFGVVDEELALELLKQCRYQEPER